MPVSLRIPRELLRLLDQAAKLESRNRSQMILVLMARALKAKL